MHQDKGMILLNKQKWKLFTEGTPGKWTLSGGLLHYSCRLSSQFNYHMKEQIIQFDSIERYVSFLLW